MKKRKKKLIGMTLVEVIVALAVFSIISAMLASACMGVVDIVRKTDRMNKKISNEAPKAELQNGGNEQSGDDSLTIKVEDSTYTIPVKKYVVTDISGIDDGGDFKYFEVIKN